MAVEFPERKYSGQNREAPKSRLCLIDL